MGLSSVAVLWTILVYTFANCVGGRNLGNSTSTGFMPFTNELIDQGLTWVKVKYLCGYDPLELPTVTQDDLNLTYALTISDIRVDGLSHVVRLANVEIEQLDREMSPGTEDVAGTTYAISSTLGIRNVSLQFHIEILKIFSLSVLDFKANGSVAQIDIPLLIVVTPGQNYVHFDSISVDNLDQIEIDVSSQNWVTTVGGGIPAVKTYIKKQIKTAIKDNIENHLEDAKRYLNRLLDSLLTFDRSKTCDKAPSSSTNTTTGIRVPVLAHKFFITPGPSPLSGLEITYRSKVIGSIPPPPGEGHNDTGLYGHYDPDRHEFVLSHNGTSYLHVTDTVDLDPPVWPLTSEREQDTISLYAQDSVSKSKVKLNPFITRDSAQV